MIEQGWTKRNIMDEPRLSELVEAYKELGMEVLLEPVDLDSKDCTECMRAAPEKYKVIYTRERS